MTIISGVCENGVPATVAGKMEGNDDDGVCLQPNSSTPALAGVDPPAERPAAEYETSTRPELQVYRQRTVALLRRYMRSSLEVGRLPSLLGREFFRTRVTSYRAHSFEDVVIFVHDVERSLGELGYADRVLIGMIALREYSQEEAAQVLGCTRRTIVRFYSEALDRVSEIFLKREILAPVPVQTRERAESCQGGLLEEIRTSDSA